MIVLDTNVLSEPLKSIPTPRVIESPDDQATDTLFMTAISHAELRFEVLKKLFRGDEPLPAQFLRNQVG